MSFTAQQLNKYKAVFTQAQQLMQDNLGIIKGLEEELATHTQALADGTAEEWQVEDLEAICDGNAVEGWDLHSNTAKALGQFVTLYSLDDIVEEMENK